MGGLKRVKRDFVEVRGKEMTFRKVLQLSFNRKHLNTYYFS